MSKPFVFEKPLGMRDIIPEVVERKGKLLVEIQKVLKAWGYRQIETPTLEYYDTVGGVSSTMEKRLFKLLDRTGRSLVLRPDMTAPIARVIGSIYKEEPFPIRLSYQGNVFRAQEKEAGRNAEFPEVGIELVGEEAPDADAEVITLAIASLQAVEVPHYKLALGHIGYMNGLFHEILADQEKEKEAKSYLQQNNYVGYRQFIQQETLSIDEKERLLALLELRGGAEQLEKAKEMAMGAEAEKAVEQLSELWEVLKHHQVTDHLFFDLTLIRDLDYYTGILFEGYAEQLGFPICNGGRYDHLLGEFGRPAPATGFAIKVDRILEVSKMNLEECQKQVLVTYTAKERSEAFQLAQELRADHALVTLHKVQSKKEKVSITDKKFDQWIRLEGGRE
ncbi:ATP phosphoribosyltransferase regulatory subunit [Caldalkalibacillus mannanilyticus]|uniref:ATP phosphoribosyltransferase regulatory subunit n=1 Tax=Caldalkalibacillus mannanilyticus TaxID=1418 RepID=UPI0004689A66|nr:ATP phosphoribosyltransferase regulatory subunit [Caldalkalibacillus mannanilyticus]